MIKLTYIYHDCFVAETPGATLVFDYWRDAASLSEPCEGDGDPDFLSRIDSDKPLYFIVSHHHKDHFNRRIFRWKGVAKEVRYIISRDVEKSIRYMLRPDSVYTGVKPDKGQVAVLRPGEVYEDNILKISAFGSTDIGNSYLVETSGARLFHAGDLNAWMWKDESTKAEIAAAIRDYTAVLDTISAAGVERIDLAMFPVDSRIGTDYWEGASIFVRRFDVGIFVPMHFGLGEDAADARRKALDATDFAAYANPERGVYAALQHPYSALSFAPGAFGCSDAR